MNDTGRRVEIDGEGKAVAVRMLVGADVDLGLPAVVHCMRDAHHVYIGRPSKWGNPFRVGRDGDRARVISLYERYLLQTPALRAALAELEGKVLGCWCAPHACHGEVLLRLSNPVRPPLVGHLHGAPAPPRPYAFSHR
jgi:hypothetical protein